MGTGLGPESYALIEQGRIGQILSSRPTDRRAIIEEAAGITKFKTKKRLAEARLEEAKQNLNRVNDIFEEVTRQMNSLKRQASKAERYARLRDEMRAKLRVVLASKFTVMDQESVSLDTQITAVGRRNPPPDRERAAVRGGALRAHPARLRDRNRNAAESRAAQPDRHRRRPWHRHAFAPTKNAAAELIARMTSSEAELAQAHNRLHGARRRARRNTSKCSIPRPPIWPLPSRNSRSASRKRNQRLRRSGGARTRSRNPVAHRFSKPSAKPPICATSSRSRRNGSPDSIAKSSVCRAENRDRGGAIRSLWRAARPARAGIRNGFAARQRPGRRDRRACASSSKASARDESDTKKHLDSIRSEYATALGKKGSLEAVIAEHGYSTESVRRLFQSGALQGGHAPAGVLADFLEVDPRYERVVEDFLRDELNYVVVKSWDAADEGLRLLRSDVDGRATFLVHPEDSQAKFSFRRR